MRALLLFPFVLLPLLACSSDPDPLPDAGGPPADTGVALDTGGAIDSGGTADTGTDPDAAADGGLDAAADVGPPPDLCEGLTLQMALDDRSPVDGEVIVFVMDRESRPIPGGTVMVTVGADSWVGAVDANGCVSFVDARLHAPLAIHAYGPGFAAESYQGYDHRSTTAFLFAEDYGNVVSTVRPGVLTGEISNLDVIGTATTTTLAWYGVVNQIRAAQGASGLTQPVRPEAMDYRTNAVIVGAFLNLPTYALDYSPFIGEGIYATAGMLPTDNPDAAAFSWFGLSTTATVALNETRRGDVALTHPLDTFVSYDIQNAPIMPFVGLRFDLRLAAGDFASLGSAFNITWPSSFLLPALTGSLAGGTYGATGYAYDRDQSHISFRYVPGTPGETNVVLDDWLVPVVGVRVVGRDVELTGPTGANFCNLVVYDPALRFQYWRARYISADPTRFSWPVPPPGFVDHLTGSLQVRIICSRAPGWDLRDFRSFDDLLDAQASTITDANF